MADCLHQIDLCPDCDGLRTTRLERLTGGMMFTITDGSRSALAHRGQATVYVGPAPKPCPNLPEVRRD